MLELSDIKLNCTWDQAMDYSTSLGEGWRLPTKEELMIIYASPRRKEFSSNNQFWSSSTFVGSTNFAWNVNFYNGFVNLVDKSNSNDARCVRGSFKDLILWCFSKTVGEQLLRIRLGE